MFQFYRKNQENNSNKHNIKTAFKSQLTIDSLLNTGRDGRFRKSVLRGHTFILFSWKILCMKNTQTFRK